MQSPKISRSDRWRRPLRPSVAASTLLTMDGFRITYTVEAAEAVGRLQAGGRDLLGRGLRVLARDPYHKATASIGTHEDNRKAQVAPGILIEYVVAHGVMVVVVLTVFDDSLYLLADDGLGGGDDV